ncbi:MAG TPA: hypothetical protein VHW71_04355 [Steroidobacteraceae bacterium]|jgi:hypothetical protein|nr:hypothetical protein [Steroidobacteraceae bacterium]
MIRTKSVNSAIDRKKDGLRILATRIRGRGLKKSRYDEWMANLGPSEKLLEEVIIFVANAAGGRPKPPVPLALTKQMLQSESTNVRLLTFRRIAGEPV